MKFVRFKDEDRIHSGVLDGDIIQEIEGDIFNEWQYTGQLFSYYKVTFLTPIIPNQVIGIGANYVATKEELPKRLPEIPVFFFKPVSSVIGPEDEIAIPEDIDQVKFESELAVVIGKKAKSISEHEALDYIFGYTIGNDVTAPQYFREDGHWMVGKSFDTFTPIGPAIETDIKIADLRVKATVNGQMKQDSSTDLMIITVSKMISYLSNIMTLNPGDVILTGSPIGAEFVKAKDIIECEINGIGVLRNTFSLKKEKEMV